MFKLFCLTAMTSLHRDLARNPRTPQNARDRRIKHAAPISIWVGLEPLESRVMLDASPFGLTSFTPLGVTNLGPVLIAGPGGLNGAPQLDLNGDGRGDMIVEYGNGIGSASGGQSTVASVSALLVNADGSTNEYRIAQYAIPPTTGLPVIDQVLVADLNGDGHPDVAVLRNDGFLNSSSSAHHWIDLFMGQADGTFTQPGPPIDLGTTVGSPTMTLFDQNGDGKADVFLESATKSSFTVYLSNGNGTVAAPVVTNFQTLLFPLSLNRLTSVTNVSASQDLDGDGIADMVVSGQVPSFAQTGSQYALYVFKGLANGGYNLTTPLFSDTTDNLTLLTVRQLSSDHQPDIVAYSSSVGPDQATSVFVIRNNGNGTFTPPAHPLNDFPLGLPTLVLGGSQQPLLTPDLTGDGSDDMILVEGGLGTNDNVTLHIEKNDGNDGFTETQQITFTSSPYDNSGLVEDVDGDGLPDLVVYRNVSPSVLTTIYFNDGGGHFEDPGVSPVHSSAINSLIAGQTSNPGLADFNGDGKLDLIYWGFSNAAQKDIVEVLLNTTGRAFGPGVDTILTPPDDGVNLVRYQPIPPDPLLDYTGDGLPDVLAFNGTGFNILASTGDGHFTTLEPSVAPGGVSVPTAPIATDINLDGKIDLLWNVLNNVPSTLQDIPGLFVDINGVAAPTDTAGSDMATALDLGTLTGPIALDQFINTTTVANTLLDASDFYKFTLASPQVVRITAVSTGGTVSLSLEDSSGTGIAGSNDPLPVVDATLAAGTYYVAVGNSDAVDTHYRLDIEFPPASPAIGVLQDFTTITSGQASPVDFGDVLVDTTDTHKVFTIRNDGLASLNLNTIAFPDGFALDPDAPAPASTLAPGASTILSVVMNVAAAGQFSGGNLAIPSNDPNTPSFMIPVSGSVAAPVVTLSPRITVLAPGGSTVTSGQATPIDFGSAAVGTPSLTQTFTVRNDGNATLTLGPITFTNAAYAIGSDPLVTSLAPGDSDTFEVVLSTATTGVLSGNIAIANNSGGTATTFNLPVTGTVTPPPMPDLTIDLSSTPSIVGPLVPGDARTLSGLVTHTGTIPANASVRIDAYLLPADQALPGVGDQSIGNAIIKGSALKTGGAPVKWSVKTIVPGNLPAGSYHYVVVVDSLNAVEESNETNNAAATDALDLVLGFGAIGGRPKPVTKLTVDNITYAYSGPGSGQVIPGVGGAPDSVVINTDNSGKATLTATAPKGVTGLIGNLTVNGYAKSVNLKGFNVEGNVDAGAGLLGSLTVGDFADGQTITLGADPANKATFSLSADTVTDLSIDSGIPIKLIAVNDWINNNDHPDAITAPSIGTITSKTDFAANITVNALTSLSAKGILISVIRSVGSINSITAGRIVNSLILVATTEAGLDTLPTAPGDFVASSNASVVKVTATGIKSGAEAGPSFVDSVIAGPSVGTVGLKDVETDNGGVEFGIAAEETIKSVSRTGTATLKNLMAAGDTDDGDFVLRIV